jgi:hypothetical protein
MNRIDERMVFIVGVGRSGTSLLQSMLHSHPNVCFVPEINFIRRFLATDDLDRNWERDRNDVISRLTSDELISRLGLGPDRISAILQSLDDHFSSRSLYLQLLSAFCQQENTKDDIQWVGDKDPRSVEFLPTLHHYFPDARILHIIRDPRDVLASKKKAEWSKDRSTLRHIFANRVQLKLGRRQGRELFGSAYIEFAYEELITDAAAVLSRVCAFLQIEFSPAMLEFSESSEIFVSQEEMQWKKETLGPLLSTNAGKWKGSLTPWETVLTERVCKEAFDTMQYQNSASLSELSLLERLALGPSTMLLAGLDPLYRFYRKS